MLRKYNTRRFVCEYHANENNLRCVFCFELFGEIVKRFYWLFESRYGKEGGQVCGIRSDHDEAEYPPGGGNQTTGKCAWSFSTT